MFINDIKDVIKECINVRRPMAIWGQTGIGKSDIVKLAAKEWGDENEIEMSFIDIRLSQIEPHDIRGVLVPDIANRTSFWLPPSMLPSDPDWVGVINFDEISSAHPMVQAAAYQLFLDRRVGEYVLPEGATLIAAGNRKSDRGVVFPMASPLANRFITHITLDLSVEQWKLWAWQNNINPLIIGFVSTNETMLHTQKSDTEEKGFASPRSWEGASIILDFNLRDEIKKETLQGGVGFATGQEFWTYKELLQGAVQTSQILDMKQDYVLPEDPSACHAMSASIIAHLKNFCGTGKAMPEDKGLAIFRYLHKIDKPDNRVAAYKDFTAAKLPLVGQKGKVKQAFDDFYIGIRHLMPEN
jgi:hypothetical protein